jgi:hypothetical protein
MFTWQTIAIIGRSTEIYQEKKLRIAIVNQQLRQAMVARPPILSGIIANKYWQ